MKDLFKEIIPNLLTGKEQLEFDNINDYNPYITNQALSYNLDCIFFAAEMNKNYNLDKKLQYDFLFHIIKKKRRKWQPWIKKEKEEDLQLIQKYYGCSKAKALEIINIFTKEQLKEMKNSLNEGGK